MRPAPLLALALLAATSAVHAQAGREQFREAARTCRYAPAPEQRVCMARELCAKNRDPASCEKRYFVNAERRDIVLEACKGKQGTVLRNCMREEYKALDDAPKLEACGGLQGAPLHECVREEYGKLERAPKS
jgi:hypothetical protein